ncbi:sarcoplasmic reticulum histidine-rich calcium-binding protein-like [Leguminivora glycinivorella]|uniref:sarcoplasmic reticulum histidine-rich calcium-binding protein-like n=1 Tax=Leguminivora glycinivorella TaxID=1035111 RepID=UPI00200C975F|nr:sarcoplasmic reticulum histidine-rich calcium-binding protein-like [Leguminivora glycinivorella]
MFYVYIMYKLVLPDSFVQQENSEQFNATETSEACQSTCHVREQDATNAMSTGHRSEHISTMAKALCVLVAVAAAASAVHVSYVAPVASGYIYRSDNGGPASLIQLGAQQYHQPAAFAPPLPVAQPLALPLPEPEVYNLAATPLTFHGEAVPLEKHIVEQDDDDDDSDDEEPADPELYGELIDLGSGHGHGHIHEKGAGSDYEEEHHAAHGEKGSKGYSSKDHHASGKSGHYGKEHKEGHYGESEGEEAAHHDEADAHGKHHEAGSSHEGGDHGHKKHFSKGEDVTGYHKVFHKDEFKKDHDFYDVADNNGHFNKYGNEKGHHGSEEGGHKEGGAHDAGYDKSEFGKAGFHAKGHHDESDDSHSAEEGKESHYSHSAEHGKNGSSEDGKEYHFVDDDDEDEDDLE